MENLKELSEKLNGRAYSMYDKLMEAVLTGNTNNLDIEEFHGKTESEYSYKFNIPSNNGQNVYNVCARRGVSFYEFATKTKMEIPKEAQQAIAEWQSLGRDPRELDIKMDYGDAGIWDYNWDHLLVRVCDLNGIQLSRCAYNEEMKEIHRMFFNSNENTMQFHPKESEYVNIEPYTLHLWRHAIHGVPFPTMEDSTVKKENYLTSSGTKLKLTIRKSNDWECVTYRLAEREMSPTAYATWNEDCEVKDYIFGSDVTAFSLTLPELESRHTDGETTIWLPKGPQKIMVPNKGLLLPPQ